MKQVLLNTPLTPLLVNYCAPQILRKTSLLQKGKKGKAEEPASSETANPIYMWMVQPKEETGLKEGPSNYDQIR